jgi:ribonuclease Z
MRTIFRPFLPNGPRGDPLLWVDLPDEGHSVMLDAGDTRAVPNRKLLRVGRVVVTHTHMDHFVGFDHLLRLILGRDRELTVTGPPGFLDRVAGRIASYTWNVIEQYPVRLTAEEIDGDVIRSMVFTAANGMRPRRRDQRPFDGTLHAHRAYTMHADLFDHGVPVVGVALRETEHLSVNKDRLLRLGLEPGPWLSQLKNAVRRCESGERRIDVPTSSGDLRREPIERLAAEILIRTAGQKIGYLTDLGYTEQNLQRAIALVGGVDLLVCEAAFLDAERQRAAERGHLTARQAGELAKACRVARLAPFHFSPRHSGRERELVEEASRAFGGPVVELPTGPVC